MKLHYIGERPAIDHNAGNKARRDVNKIFARRGYIPIENIVETRFVSTVDKIKYVLNKDTWKKIYRLCEVDGLDVIAQFPVYGNKLMRAALKELFDCNRMIFVIHDLDALRNFAAATVEGEIDRLKRSRLLIVHNKKMIAALKNLNVTTPMIALDLFDYLLDDVPTVRSTVERNRIIFAGNLTKSAFLRSIGDIDIKFNLYGPGGDALTSIGNVNYKGSFAPEVVPFKLEGGFGLIWDGDSIDTCAGAFGDYLKLNNPHKLSLYIAAGLPVVTWTHAAIADFIIDNGIGLTVESLRELPRALDNISVDAYQKMLDNSARIQKEIIAGRFTERALDQAENILVGGG